MPWLYTVEQGKIKKRSDARNLGFLFQYLDMNFSAVSFKAHKSFLKWFLLCCFRLSCTSYVMGTMLR